MNFIGQLKIDERFLSSIALLSIFLGGLWVRVTGISGYYYNPDEMEYLIIAKGETLAEVWRRGLAELHPPLAHFIRHYLLMISPDVFHQRLFSVAAGMLSIIGMYRVGFQLRGRFLGLFCALCMAFLPVAVSTSITIRNYAFFMAFLSWALYFFLRYQTQEKRSDLLYFTLLLLLASATHFTGFLVGAACGISEGLRLASAKRWNKLAWVCVSFLPLLLLGVFLYFHFLAPGTAGPMWDNLSRGMSIKSNGANTGFSSKVGFTLERILFYFSPLLSIEQKTNTDLFILLFSVLVLFSVYFKGLLKMYKEKRAAFTLMLVIWGIAVFAALASFYPFMTGRQNYYFLPFFVLPLGYELEYFVRSIPHKLFAQYFAITVVILMVFFLKKNEGYLKYAGEFTLKQKDYKDGQVFLDQHLQPNDLIVTSGFSAYHYLLYHKDAGKTPYDSYADVPYHHGATILAPFNRPFKPNHSWEPFRDNLKSRLASNIATPESKVWFVMYSWKNIEVWPLLNCQAISPQIHDYFSRDGVLIFSIQVKTFSHFLKKNAVWELCYSGYKPFWGFETLKAYPQITQVNELTD